KWRERVHPPHLGEGIFLATAVIVGEGVGGQIGLREMTTDLAEIRMIKDGCVLFEACPRGPVPGLLGVLVADFEPNSAYDDARHNRIYARAVFALLGAIERMMTTLAHSDAALAGRSAVLRRVILDYLVAATEQEYVLDVAEEFGFSRTHARRQLSGFDLDACTPSWELDSEKPHPLTAVPLFRTHGGEVLSLLDVHRQATKTRRMPFLPEDSDCSGLDGVSELPKELLLLGAVERTVLYRLIGHGRLMDFSPVLRTLWCQAKFLRKPRVPLNLSMVETCELSVEIESESRVGVVGLHYEAEDRTDRDFRAHVHVRKFHRGLEVLSVRMLVPGVVAIVNDDEVETNEEWTALGGSRKGADALADVRDAIPKLVARALDNRFHQRTLQIWLFVVLSGIL
ncbi:MAG: hypothetical protein ACPG77_18010, partial [Nannocystaceae bacterium]